MKTIPGDIMEVAVGLINLPIQPSHDFALAIAGAIFAERKRCAYLASSDCLVPPDGGSPTEAEVSVCEEASRRIMGEA